MRTHEEINVNTNCDDCKKFHALLCELNAERVNEQAQYLAALTLHGICPDCHALLEPEEPNGGHAAECSTLPKVIGIKVFCTGQCGRSYTVDVLPDPMICDRCGDIIERVGTWTPS